MAFSTPIAHAFTPAVVEGSSGATGPNIATPILPPQQQGFPFGQNHKYSVVLRGNGEAVVTLNTVFSNQTEKPLSSLTFRIPKGNLTDILAFQLMREPTCLQSSIVPELALPTNVPKCRTTSDLFSTPVANGHACINPVNGSPYYYECSPGYKSLGAQCISSNSTLNNGDKLNPVLFGQCAQYQVPNFYNYWSGTTKYQKAQVQQSGDTITITLPQSVAPNETGSIVLYYRAMGYVTKDIIGALNFSFETLKIEDRIASVEVGISTDSDLLLKDVHSEVNYRFNNVGTLMAAQSISGSVAVSNPQFDSFYQQIGRGMIVKNSSDLQPLDSYVITGKYAKNHFQLYASDILIRVIPIIIFVFLVVFVLIKILRKYKQTLVMKTSEEVPPIVGILSVSFLTAFCVVSYTVILLFLIRFIQTYSRVSSDINSLIVILFLVISIGVYAFMLAAAPVYIGIKRGIKWGATTFGISFLWMILFTVIVVVFLILSRSMNVVYNYPPQPLLPMIQSK